MYVSVKSHLQYHIIISHYLQLQYTGIDYSTAILHCSCSFVNANIGFAIKLFFSCKIVISGKPYWGRTVGMEIHIILLKLRDRGNSNQLKWICTAREQLFYNGKGASGVRGDGNCLSFPFNVYTLPAVIIFRWSATQNDTQQIQKKSEQYLKKIALSALSRLCVHDIRTLKQYCSSLKHHNKCNPRDVFQNFMVKLAMQNFEPLAHTTLCWVSLAYSLFEWEITGKALVRLRENVNRPTGVINWPGSGPACFS